MSQLIFTSHGKTHIVFKRSIYSLEWAPPQLSWGQQVDWACRYSALFQKCDGQDYKLTMNATVITARDNGEYDTSMLEWSQTRKDTVLIFSSKDSIEYAGMKPI